MANGPKDIEGYSNAVLDGSMRLAELPDDARNGVMQYWAQSGVDVLNPQSAVTQAQIEQLVQQRQGQVNKGILDTFLESPVYKPIEWVGSKLYAFYSATISPAFSAGAMAAHNVIYGRPEGAPAPSFGESEWDYFGTVWDQAHSVSPGQALWMLGLNNEELKARGISPEQIAADKKSQLAGTYRDEKTTDDPFGTLTRAQEYFDKGGAKYATGAADFAVSWYMDPLVLGGKAAGVTKAAVLTKSVPGMQAGIKVGPIQVVKPKSIDEIAGTSTFQGMVDNIMQIKKDPKLPTALTLRDRFQTIKQSADGDLLARLLEQAKDADEVSDIMRVSIGDKNGLLNLRNNNAKLAGQISQSKAGIAILDSSYASMTIQEKAGMAGQQLEKAIKRENQMLQMMEDQSRVISDKMDAFGTVRNLNYNRVLSPVGQKIRGSEAVSEGKLKSVRGQGILKGSTSLIYNASVGIPIKLAHTYSNIRPTPYIDIHSQQSYKELEATLADTKLISKEERDYMVNRYLKAGTEERSMILSGIEQRAVNIMAEKAGLSPELARDLYSEFAKRRGQVQEAARQGRQYSTARMEDPNAPGMTVNVAAVLPDGSRLVQHPLLETQLANSHVMMDFSTMEKAIKAHGARWERLRKYTIDSKLADKWYQNKGVVDDLNTIWKFTQLLRLGYGPRALADDFLGQVARFGASMHVANTVSGTKDMANRWMRARWTSDATEMSRDLIASNQKAIEELNLLQRTTSDDMVRVRAAGGDVTAHETMLDDVQAEIEKIREETFYAQAFAESGGKKGFEAGGQYFDAPLGGARGSMYEDLLAGDRNVGNMMSRQADWYLKRMRRGDWQVIEATGDGAEHLAAWGRSINQQIAQSGVGRQALMGKSASEIADWMRYTPEGVAYRKDINLKNIGDYELAERIKAHVDHVMDPNVPGMNAMRQAALDGRLDLDELAELVPIQHRPSVNGQMWEYASGKDGVSQLIDKSMTAWYKWMNNVPAQKLLRNPLFNTQYKAHVFEQMQILRKQGVTHIDEALRQQIQETARKSAIQEVKRFTFNMDHETKMAYALRNFGAFFGAQQESWNRWARIISEKPDVLARVGQVYGAPSRAGMTVDGDGNTVDAAGFVTDPVTGEKKLVPYKDRRILVQVPEYLGGKKLNKFLGLDENSKFVIPMSTAEIVLNHGDGALPVGVGPYIQVPVNSAPFGWGAKDNPDTADWARKLGVLPFGPQESVWDFVNPNTGKKLNESIDDFSSTKQRTLYYAMQVENWKYENGLRADEPTWEELSDRADRWAIARTAFAFGLPISVNAQDPYQFFRDEYQRMAALDRESADEKFYEKYGDSFYNFAKSMSKNQSGLRPTKEAVQMSQYYKDLISKVGTEYAGLVVGDEGEGVYSEGAYYYMKTHGGSAGDNTPMIKGLSAEEAFTKAQEARGWMQYNKLMEETRAKLYDAGFISFEDPGAEALSDEAKANKLMLTSRYNPDGTLNKYYNADWAAKFNTLQKDKYDQTARDLESLVSDPELMAKAFDEKGNAGIRSEIAVLGEYLTQRRNMTLALNLRDQAGGSIDINAKVNSDLKASWSLFVMGLLEKNTKFGRLFDRYFPTDMGFNMELTEEAGEDEAAALEEQAGFDVGGGDLLDFLEQGGISPSDIGRRVME